MRTRTIKKSAKRKRPPSVRVTGAKRRTNPITTYWKGDLAEYTGKSKVFYGGLFYELILLEGTNKGKKVWTDQPPKKKNPQYKVEAKVPSNIRPITHEVKVPTRTLAVLATRGYVQEMGGGNPNAYTYKSTKLGLGKWRVEAVPKVKSSSGTVKALTAGSAVRKFKKTLAGRGRFKTPRGAYEISVARNPATQAQLDQVQREIDQIQPELAKYQSGVARARSLGAVGDRIRQGRRKIKELSDKLANLKIRERQIKLGLKQAALRAAKNPKRKRRNPPATGFLAAGKIYRKLEELKRQPLTMRRTAAIYKLEKALEKAYASAYAAERAKDASLYEAPRMFSTTKRKGGGVRKKKANPRRRKPAVKAARKNSVKSTIKKVVKSVKKVFKKKNDGSSDREEFAGKVSGYKELFFPPGTPHGLSTLGPLVHIETDKANIRPAKGMAVLCQDSNHNLYIGSVTPDAAAYTGSESLRNKNLGKVTRIEYRCSKPHLGAEYKGNITWYHDFEAPLPTLKTDSDGRFIFSGGGYTIKREGITG